MTTEGYMRRSRKPTKQRSLPIENRAVAERLMAKGFSKRAAVQISNKRPHGAHKSGKPYPRLRGRSVR